MKKQLTIGVDVGGTNTVLGLIDREGNCLARTEFHTQRSTNEDGPVFFDEYMDLLYAAIERLLEAVPEDGRVDGIGIGAPNANYYKGAIINAANLTWKDRSKPSKEVLGEFEKQNRCEVVKLLKKRFPAIKAIAMTNDANAAALGELHYGGGKNLKRKDLVEITLGTGLGSGFVSNGDIVYGHNSFAGELGHIIVEPGGRNCGCGNNGCLETYASATGIRRTALNLIDNTGTPSSLRKIERDKLSAKDVSIAAAAGDKLALEVWDITAHYLALGIATAVVVTAPEAVFLFGGPTKAGDLLMTPLKKYLDKYMLAAMKDTKVMFSKLGDNAAILGASALALNAIAALKK
ncbi:MAG: ROK family protein [Tidjanibacter sp.]|nr:ROK family protein [Tidjanibacter sp.]